MEKYSFIEEEKPKNWEISLPEKKKKFPRAEILNEDPKENLKETEGQYIRIRTVKPSCIEEVEGGERELPLNMPSHIKKFYKNTDLNVFTYSKPFTKTNSGNELRDTWIRKTYIFTSDRFPAFVRRSLVTKRVVIDVSSIESSINTIKDKNEELIQMIETIEATKVWKSSFTMTMKGIIDASVNGGVNRYKEAFLCEEYQQIASSQELQLIPMLQDALDVQIQILERAMKLHEGICPENMLKLHQALEVQLLMMKESIDKVQNLSPNELKILFLSRVQWDLNHKQSKEGNENTKQYQI